MRESGLISGQIRLVSNPLVGAEPAGYGDSAGEVADVVIHLGAVIDEHELSLAHGPVTGVVRAEQLDEAFHSVRPGLDVGAICDELGTCTFEGVFDLGRDLSLVDAGRHGGDASHQPVCRQFDGMSQRGDFLSIVHLAQLLHGRNNRVNDRLRKSLLKQRAAVILRIGTERAAGNERRKRDVAAKRRSG